MTRQASALLLAAFATLSAHGATFYWDANGSTPGAGGTGTWSDGTGNWSTDVAGTLTTTWNNAASPRNIADLRGTAGTVTVSGGVTAESLQLNAGGYTLSGGTLSLGRASGTGNVTLLNYASGTGNNTISSNIVVDDVGTAGSAANYTFTNSGTGSLTLGGNITPNYSSGTPLNNKALVFQTGNSGASIVLNGSISQGANGGAASLWNVTFGQGGTTQANALALNGTFYVNAANTYGRGTTINGGTVIVSHNNALGSGTIAIGTSGARGDMKLLTDGARIIANAVSTSGASTGQVYIGANTAHESTFSGGFNLNGFGTAGTGGNPGTISSPNPIFTAVAGGKVNFTGAFSASSLIPRGIVKQGAGVVSLGSLTGNTYKGPTTIQEGTLLFMNTSGSATGDASQLAPGAVAVTVAADAKLGGTGITTGLVGASAANSIFTPGDMTKDGVSSLGTLRLHGGLAAANGATFAYDISGFSIDSIGFGSGSVSIGNTATFNFTSLGSVEPGHAYSLFTGTGDWSSVSASFVFNAPAGYVLDTGYGTNGYFFDAASHEFTVQFAASTIPEPSSFAALAGLGALGAVALRRRRRA